MAFILCSTTIIVTPLSRIFLMSRVIVSVSWAFMPVIGSSRRRSFGLVARAMQTLRTFWWLRWEIGCCLVIEEARPMK